MYNPQLETFIRVADAGSFNKAAEESFITPTAVIKQINLLEDSLGVKLFDRTHRGLHLTKAGHSLYQDSKYIIQYCRDSITRAKNAMQEDSNIIRIGSSPITPAQLLMELWSRVQALHPNIKFQIVPFENTPENAREILANLGKNIDIVGGIFDDTMLDVRACAGLELIRGRFIVLFLFTTDWQPKINCNFLTSTAKICCLCTVAGAAMSISSEMTFGRITHK